MKGEIEPTNLDHEAFTNRQNNLCRLVFDLISDLQGHKRETLVFDLLRASSNADVDAAIKKYLPDLKAKLAEMENA
jgi:hypothetical protein